MKASDIMTLGAATVQLDDSAAHALHIMVSHHISALPVLDSDAQLKGIVTEGDFFRPKGLPNDLNDILAMPAEARARALDLQMICDLMTHNPITIDVEAPVHEAVALMEKHAVKRLPVTFNSKVVGMISRADLLNALIA